jgi:hypothetical protein
MANCKEDTMNCKVWYIDWEKKDNSVALHIKKEGKQ